MSITDLNLFNILLLAHANFYVCGNIKKKITIKTVLILTILTNCHNR